jgi:biotin-dependent carboxylase-like uncharacterized protein
MIKFISSGLYTSLQDEGRFGHRASGVPVSGAMDQISAQKANVLVGNSMDEVLMEITLQGPVLLFTEAATIAVTGAGFNLTLNTVAVAMYTTIQVEKGDTLIFGNASYGVRGYLAISGGLEVPLVLGSASMCHGITSQVRLLKGAELSFSRALKTPIISSVKEDASLFSSEFIDAYPGPDFALLDKEQQERVWSQFFTISNDSNRMAYTLTGLEGINVSEIITAPVQPGTVQLMPSDVCAVLMRDAQTTGGYARVLQLSEQAICLLSQKRGGNVVKFKLKQD